MRGGRLLGTEMWGQWQIRLGGVETLPMCVEFEFVVRGRAIGGAPSVKRGVKYVKVDF